MFLMLDPEQRCYCKTRRLNDEDSVKLYRELFIELVAEGTRQTEKYLNGQLPTNKN